MTATESTKRSTAPKRGLSQQVTACLILVIVLVLAAIGSLIFGARSVSLPTLNEALLHFDESISDHLVIQSRVARTVGGVVVGAALGLSGAAMQGLTRNPLADSGILGLNAGAALAVVTGIAFFGMNSLSGTMVAAFIGAAVVMTLVYVVASVGREGATPLKLALSGAALSVGFTAVTSAVLMVSPLALDEFRFWQIGTLAARDIHTYLIAIPVIVVGTLIVLSTARVSNAVAMGEDSATALGFRLGRARIIGSIGIVLLVGTATAVAGPIAFVGLMIPHAVRLLVGSDYRWLMPASILAGPILLLVADTLGRVINPPGEIQVGVMCAILGAPLFIIMMRSGMKSVSL